jgi:hypothetical protein
MGAFLTISIINVLANLHINDVRQRHKKTHTFNVTSNSNGGAYQLPPTGNPSGLIRFPFTVTRFALLFSRCGFSL